MLDRPRRGDCLLTLQASSCRTKPRARSVLACFGECRNKLFVSSVSICQFFISFSLYSKIFNTLKKIKSKTLRKQLDPENQEVTGISFAATAFFPPFQINLQRHSIEKDLPI